VLGTAALGFAPGVGAFSAIEAAGWATRVSVDGTPIASFLAPLAATLVVALLLVLGPLFAWSAPLARARLSGEADYRELAMDYVRRFEARWEPGQGDRRSGELLGTPDIQSLADLANGFAIIQRTRIVPFGTEAILAVVVAVLVPAIPVVLLEIPVGELLRRLVVGALGAAPG
jgi:hypothetical protein